MGVELTPSAVQEIAEELASRYLSAYTDTLRTLQPQFGRKEINDALWGTIVLTPMEVVILDSPLLQRLRYIRQLGVVHWIYPGAVHTRFEHTLGVLFQMQQLIAALNTAAKIERTDKPDQPALIGDNEAQLLRMCALLHDVGHAAFSHVSERAIEALPEFATLSRAFSDQLAESDRGEDKQLSEMLAYYIVRSPAMRELLHVLLTQYGPDLHFNKDQAQNLEAIVEKTSRALIGRKIDDKRPLLHELISGPYDADKLDYLVRDARCAGTPSLLDIPRLVQKLTARPMLAQDLPQDIGGQIFLDADEEVWLFGIKMSGASVLDELQLARVLAYAKIYRHPKVIAIEQMMRAFIEAIAKQVSWQQLLIFLFTQADDAILTMSPVALGEALGLDVGALDPAANEQLVNAEATLMAIRERRLWVRAFQLSSPYPSEQQGTEGTDGLDLFRGNLDHPQMREEFVTLVRDEVHKMLTICGGVGIPSRVALDSMIMARVLKLASGETQIGRAFLIQKGEPPRQLSEHMKLRGSWVEQYMSDQPRVYIFSAPAIADAVFIAAQKILRTQYEVRLPGWAVETSKRNAGALLAYKRRLAVGGYWQGVPHDIRPIHERLERSDVKTRISKFDLLRSAYQEPDGPTLGAIQKKKRTMAWLRQFDTTDHVECALCLLDHFKMLTREDAANALRTFISANAHFRGSWVAPFGSAKDSSAVWTYFSRDLNSECIERLGSLDDYVKSGDSKPLIFIDDFIGSGSQATDILAAWFDRQDLRKDLGEQRDALDPTIRKRLLAVPIAFVFISGWNDGIDAIGRIAKEIGLNATVHCHLREGNLPFARELLLKDFSEQKVDDFLRCCEEIGADLVRSELREKPLDGDKVQARALGYGGRAMLLASPVNVPAQTLTAISMAGTADGVAWTPLLWRRKKI